jgi:hypothetical protein
MSSFGEAFVSGGSVIGVEMAIERINSNNSLLSNHTLYFNGVVDSQASSLLALYNCIISQSAVRKERFFVKFYPEHKSTVPWIYSCHWIRVFCCY